MTATISRRGLLHRTAALGVSAIAGELGPMSELGRSEPVRKEEKSVPTLSVDSPVQLFYRDDSLCEPWLKPEPVLLVHGNGQSSEEWFRWVPRLAQEFRVLRPDLPGFGHSAIPRDFEWSLANLATVLAHFLDTVEVESAHIIGAKVGGVIAMQFAADYPQRTRTLVVASSPVTHTRPEANSASAIDKTREYVAATARERFGSATSKEEVEYWSNMMVASSPETKKGIAKVNKSIDMEGILPRITAPTLVITSDRSAMQSVETVLRYQQKIPNSRLLVLPCDFYDVAIAKADECVTSVLSFIKETRQTA